MSESKEKLQQEYELRFSGLEQYRNKVWQILCRDFFQQYVPDNAKIMDVGSGYGEFISNISAAEKFAMDLNPDGKKNLPDNVCFVNQDCSEKWDIEDDSLDIVFSSNFLEHLFEKKYVEKTIQEAYRCLKKSGKIILLGPNIRFLPGEYWDFWDHNVAISDRSMEELLRLKGFDIITNVPQFLPYTISNDSQPPLLFVKMYLKLRFAWRFFGKQFLVVGEK